MDILTRNQNSAVPNRNVSDELLYVNPAIADIVEEIEMNIAEDGMDFIFDMLSDLSANRGAYALREAYSNAYDATVLTGDMTRPIEINLVSIDDDETRGIAGAVARFSSDFNPTSMFATITDHGIGMTTEDVKKYFTQYGGSKKRGGVLTVGSKGLGSKAPLACSDVFMVESTRDGVTTYAAIERKNGRNSATVRFEETGKDSGTTITIPIIDKGVYNQMKECAEDLIKWNLDATIIYNGTVISPKFAMSTAGSVLAVNDRYNVDYTYLGEIAVAENESGEPVMFRMWERTDCFPHVNVPSIDLNLAGVCYHLYGNSSIPDVIVAGEPGYLNFTPSRDEIKEDTAKARFVKAVKEGLASADFGKVAGDMLEGMSLSEMCTWVFSGWSSVAKISRCEDGKVLIKRIDDDVELAIPRSVFVKDGIDCIDLFDGGMPRSADEFSVIVSAKSGNCTKFSYGAVSSGCYDVSTNSTLTRPEIRDITKKKLSVDGAPRINASYIFKLLQLTDRYITATSLKCIVLTEFDGDWQQFVNCEKGIRAAYNCTGKVVFILTEKNQLSATDENVFSGIPMEVATFADAVAKSKKGALKARLQTSDSFEDTFKRRYGKNETYVLDIEYGKKRYEFKCRHPRDTYYDDYCCHEVNLANISSWSDFAEHVVVYLFGNMSYHYPQVSEKIAVAAIVEGMVNTGHLPSTINQVMFTNKMNITDMRAFVAAGGEIFADTREKPFNEFETLADSTDGLDMMHYDGETKFSFDIDPALVMSDAEITELDAKEELYHRILSERGTMQNVYAMCSLLDDEKYPFASAMKSLIAAAYGKRSLSHYRISFKTSKLDPSIAALDNTYRALVALRDEIFSEISLDNFYQVRYNYKNSEVELHFKKNAEMLLHPVVNDMAEKMLAA